MKKDVKNNLIAISRVYPKRGRNKWCFYVYFILLRNTKHLKTLLVVSLPLNKDGICGFIERIYSAYKFVEKRVLQQNI
jgi:hypothetical protein